MNPATRLAARVNAHIARPGGVVEWQLNATDGWRRIGYAIATPDGGIMFVFDDGTTLRCRSPEWNDPPYALRWRTEVEEEA